MPRLTQSGFYERGLTDFLNVLDAERQRFEIEAQYEIISLSLNLTAMSVCGTKRTSPGGLAMSVDGGGPEVTGGASNRRY